MPDETGEGGEGGSVAQPPPATEEQRWRKRALESEERVKELEEGLARAKADLDAAHETIDACERRREIDQALWEAGAADLETARLLTEIAVSRMETPDVRAAVAELAAGKPFLFRRARPGTGLRGIAGDALPGAAAPSGGSGGGSGVMSALPREEPGALELAAIADEAAATGDRAALLRYLRLRRGIW